MSAGEHFTLAQAISDYGLGGVAAQGDLLAMYDNEQTVTVFQTIGIDGDGEFEIEEVCWAAMEFGKVHNAGSIRTCLIDLLDDVKDRLGDDYAVMSPFKA